MKFKTPEELINGTKLKIRPDTPWFVQLLTVLHRSDPGVILFIETEIVGRMMRYEHVVRTAESLTKEIYPDDPNKFGRINNIIVNLIADGVLRKQGEEVFLTSDIKTYCQYVLTAPPPLLETNIMVKGEEVQLRDLYFFYKNLHWLFESQPHLEFIYIGRAKLTKAEADELYLNLSKQGAFV